MISYSFLIVMRVCASLCQLCIRGAPLRLATDDLSHVRRASSGLTTCTDARGRDTPLGSILDATLKTYTTGSDLTRGQDVVPTTIISWYNIDKLL
jgi:hypothetical protein